MTYRTQGMLSALICIGLWAFIPVVSRLGQVSLDNHQFLFWSSFFSCLTVLALSWKTGQLHNLKQYTLPHWGKACGLGLLGTYVYFLLLYKGYPNGKGMEVLIVQYTWPIFIALLSTVLLREKFTLRKGMALLLGFAAVVTVPSRGNMSELSFYQPQLLLWVALGALCFALFSVLSKSMKQEPLSLMLVFFMVATVASFFSMLLFSGFAMPVNNKGWLIVIISGVAINGMSDVLWLWALRRTEASFLAPLVFIAPVLSTIYMLLFFDEPFLPVYGIALVLIIAAGLVSSAQVNKSFFRAETPEKT